MTVLCRHSNEYDMSIVQSNNKKTTIINHRIIKSHYLISSEQKRKKNLAKQTNHIHLTNELDQKPDLPFSHVIISILKLDRVAAYDGRLLRFTFV